MTNAALYKLEPFTDNPQYEGFAFVRQESLRGEVIGGQSRLIWDFGTNNIKTKGRGWTVPFLAPFWTPQPVVGRVRAFNDYPCINLLIPAFSQRAVDVLSDYLIPNGELLPLVSTIGDYYAYNITTVVDILDQENSTINWMDERREFPYLHDIERYECVAGRMAGLSIFLVVEKPSTTYVSQQFVDRVQEHNLNGFHFVKLWPLPRGKSWRKSVPNK